MSLIFFFKDTNIQIIVMRTDTERFLNKMEMAIMSQFGDCILQELDAAYDLRHSISQIRAHITCV